MLVEGEGMVAPACRFIALGQCDVSILDNYARDRDRYRRYVDRADAWGRGLIKHPILYGLMGEHALCVYLRAAGLNLSVNRELLPRGDGGADLSARGLDMQVKTNVTGTSNLIRRIDDRRRLLPLGCDLFVFTSVSTAPLGVNLKGWIWASDASACDMSRIRRSRVAEHWNLMIDPRSLQPMNRLIVEMQSRGDA